MEEEARAVSSFPMTMIGPRILIYPIQPIIKESSLILASDDLDLDVRDQDNSRETEKKAFNLFDDALEHPYQAIIVAIGEEAEALKLKVGDVVYGSPQMLLSRDEVMINDDIYKVVGTTSIYGVVGNIKLKEEQINSLILK